MEETIRSIAEYQLCKCKIHVTKQQQNLVRVYIKLKGYTVNELEELFMVVRDTRRKWR